MHAKLQKINKKFLTTVSIFRKLEELMKHHVVIGRVKTESIADNHKVDSIDEANALRLKVYRKASIKFEYYIFISNKVFIFIQIFYLVN